MPHRYSPAVLARLLDELSLVRAEALALEREHAAELAPIPEIVRPSARNLLHYLALRRRDLRPLQLELTRLGLSSLGRTEASTLTGLDAVLLALHRLAGRPWALESPPEPPLDHDAGAHRLHENTERLLGPEPHDRSVRILVTMPSEAADDVALVRALLGAGTDLVRINAAHDDPAVWAKLVANVRHAASGRSCRVLFDLAGPKLRTAALSPGPRVARRRPRRDMRGVVVERAVVLLASAEASAHADAIPLVGEIVAAAQPGDSLRLVDASGRTRCLRIEGRRDGLVVATADRSVRFETDCTVELLRGQDEVATGRIGELPAVDVSFHVETGDKLRVVREDVEPCAPVRAPDGTLLEAAVVPTTLGDALRDVQPGESIWFDDGRIGGVVEAVRDGGLDVRVHRTQPGGANLRADKGVNLPDTDLRIPCPTAADLDNLDFAAEHVDLVGMSFVQRPEELLLLERELDRRSAGHLGIVLKIETRRAFEALPQLLLTGLRSPPIGVMVARGDLAVEVGFARLAEVQEEILWLSEAAHVPVIWATQVLETLAKTGLPSRAEVSDAAMGVRAECVMLNKGPYVVEAVRLLDDVLRRMRSHQTKKRSLLRPLHVSGLPTLPRRPTEPNIG